MTKRTRFPLVNCIITWLAVALIAFLFIVPRNYLIATTEKLRIAVKEAETAILHDDLDKANEAIQRMCADFKQAEQPLKQSQSPCALCAC